MKKSVTKFDLEAAFKALDEIAIPKADKVRANKPALTEIFSRKSKFDALMEEYYDIGSNEGLEDAKEAREAEIAQAKLARIEKIVDLDAESADDLLTSYVGKLIIQCPQCMTLFYKNAEDVEASEDDPSTVNVNEICQHCGNESGYSLIGKVGEATPEEPEEEVTSEEPDEELDLEIEDDETVAEDEASGEEENPEENLDFDADLEDLDFELEDEETSEEGEEKKEESFIQPEGQVLTEELVEEVDFNVSDAEFDKLMGSSEFKKPISDKAVRAMLAMEEAIVEEAKTLDEEMPAKEVIQPDKNKGQDQETASKPVDDADAVEEPLKEGIKDLFSNIKAKLQSRAQKADWLLENALTAKGYAELPKKTTKADASNLTAAPSAPDPERQFTHFLVICYEETQKHSEQKFTKAPVWDHKLLVPITNKTKKFSKYIGAESYAINASSESGPVSIFLANKNSDNISFLCMFFGGKLVKETDQLEKYFSAVLKKLNDIKPAAKRADKAAEYEIKDEEEVDTSVTTAKESLDAIFKGLDELQEGVLESMIADSLIEAYGNVAGFRLKSCTYNDSKFMIEGIIHFTSGNTRPTAYAFTTAQTENDKIAFKGLNEKLGTDKQFIISGRTENKTFIAESFKAIKKH